MQDGYRGGGEELQRAHKKHKYQISVRMQKRNTYNFESAGACFEGGCVAARGCIMRPGYRLCLTEIGMRPGRCRWLALVQGPNAGMRSLGDDCRGRSRRGSRAQGAHKASQARTWVCRAYVQMACRLLGTSNRRTMHGIRYPGQVLKEEGEGG